MNLNELKQKIIGRKLMSIISLDPTNVDIRNIIRLITKQDSGLDSARLLVFENNVELIFSDYDSDGYRSGDWYLSILSDVLDKGATKEIKNINSIVRDIVYFENKDDKDYFMLTTDEYIVMMGQDSSDSYYPSNFFDIEECKKKVISDMKIVKGENIK